MTGYRVNDRGAIVAVERPDRELAALRREAAGASASRQRWDVQGFIRWFLDDRSAPRISPFSRTTIPECRAREAEWRASHPEAGN